jgi:hypothetical protein
MDDTKVIVRTSDRMQFMRCRTLWDFTSKMRHNFEYSPGIEPLDFGIAIHGAAEVYWDPAIFDGPLDVREQLALVAFHNHMNDWAKRIKAAGMWESKKDTWEEHLALGVGMLNHYFLWAPNAFKGYRPVKAEIEFEVPIPYNEDVQGKLPPTFCELDGHLWRNYPDEDRLPDPVVYQGRIDLILEHEESGELWILDHKTAAQFGQTEHLELDQQCGSYVWALRKLLNINIAGVIYSEWRKKAPKEPDMLKSGLPSKNKAQNTTPELYRKKLEELGLDTEMYADFLQTLQNEGQQYFRNIPIHRSTDELAALEANIVNMAIDMVDNPRIYPNPSRWNCNGCQFRSPCLMRQEGSDWEWYLNSSTLYVKRGGTN